jgi:predicted type IV restriction endonuclease
MSGASREHLVHSIKTIRQRIQQIRNRHESIGEQNTKATLIDPLLAALGWDLFDIDEVCREYRRKAQDNPVDYGLFLHRVPCLFVEAKALEKDLSDRKWTSQVLGYATVVGVEWCVLTNGDEYRIYNSHAPVDVDEKLFRTVRISDPCADDHLIDTLELLSKENMGENRLKLLWKAQFVDRHVKHALYEIITSEDDGLVRLIRKRTPELTPSAIRDSLKRADFRIEYPVMASVEHPAPVQSNSHTEESGVTIPHSLAPTSETRTPSSYGVEVIHLIRAGLLTSPLDIFKMYKKVRLTATILEDGRVSFNGDVYDSLSTSAGQARKTVIGAPTGRKYPQTNGWTFWKFIDPLTGEEEEIDSLRKQYCDMHHPETVR